MTGGTNAARMQEFLILGPLEVRSEEGPIALGGRRPARAFWPRCSCAPVASCPTEQLVDELYGADPPPKTRPRRCRTPSSRSGRRSARTSSSPGRRATCSTVTAEQIDARRFERLLADARASAPEERRALLLRALDLWRGPPLAEFAFEEWAQTEARRLDELRLVAGEERIAADVELGRAADVVPELESLVREHPLRERPCELLMRALYTAGRQADALAAYDAHRAALDELGLEPGERSGALQASILRHEAGLTPGRNGGDARRRRGGRQGARRGPRRPRARARRRQSTSPHTSRPPSATRATVRSTSPACLAVRRDDERLGAALRRAAPALRGGARAAARAPVPGGAARRCSASAARRIS